MPTEPQTILLERLFEIALESRLRMETLGNADTMRGLCALAALDLFRALRTAHIPSQFAIGQNHCFCLVNDLIVDTTATQFRNVNPIAGVWIASSIDPDFIADPGVWRVSALFDSEDELLASNIWQSWPQSERPHAYGGINA